MKIHVVVANKDEHQLHSASGISKRKKKPSKRVIAPPSAANKRDNKEVDKLLEEAYSQAKLVLDKIERAAVLMRKIEESNPDFFIPGGGHADEFESDILDDDGYNYFLEKHRPRMAKRKHYWRN